MTYHADRATNTGTRDPEFDAWFDTQADAIAASLIELIAFNTVSPDEDCARDWLIDHFSRLGCDAEIVAAPPELATHDAYADPALFGAQAAQPPSTLRLRLAGRRELSVCVNAHVDVVPADADAFLALHTDGIVTGRGATDTKGNIIMLATALAYLRHQGVQPTVGVVIDLVQREEVGGSGTLAAVLAPPPEPLLAAIVLEPTSLVPHPGHRGCVTVEAEFRGRAVHMGAADGGVDAIALAIEYISGLRALQTTLARDATLHPGYTETVGAGRVNVGRIRGGEWHGTIPERCVVGANIGYAPPRDIRSVMAEVEAIGRSIDTAGREFGVEFRYGGLRNEAYHEDENDYVVHTLLDTLGPSQRDIAGVAQGWGASCDAHLYHRIAKIPTVIFGCGTLAQAHSATESVALADLAQGARRLAATLTSPVWASR